VIGTDKGTDILALARKNFPTLQFEELDCLVEQEKLLLLGRNCNKVFIDIGIHSEHISFYYSRLGGNREIEAVKEAVRILQQVLYFLFVLYVHNLLTFRFFGPR
jgi:hypothetical protein